MRIFPAALWKSAELAGENIKGADFIFNISSVTHAHIRSKIGCLIYSKLIADMLYASKKMKR